MEDEGPLEGKPMARHYSGEPVQINASCFEQPRKNNPKYIQELYEKINHKGIEELMHEYQKSKNPAPYPMLCADLNSNSITTSRRKNSQALDETYNSPRVLFPSPKKEHSSNKAAVLSPIKIEKASFQDKGCR